MEYMFVKVLQDFLRWLAGHQDLNQNIYQVMCLIMDGQDFVK